MGYFIYSIVTSTGSATGTIEAPDAHEAKSQLAAQYMEGEANFSDENGKPVAHEIVSIDISAV